jgi:hypothetical protein
MASSLKTTCTLVVFLTIFIVLVSGSHSQSLTPFVAGTRTVTADPAGGPPAVLTPIMQQSMQDLGFKIESLGAVRSTLLQKAAQDPHDLENLEAASQAYRDSILRARSTIAELREELGPEQANQLVGMMMNQTMVVSRRVLMAEIFGEM